MHVIERIGVEWRTRGPAGFARFARTRLWQVREDVLFEARFEHGQNQARGARLERVVMVDKRALGSVQTKVVEADVLTEQNFAYREAISGRDVLFAATDESGRVTSYGFVLFDSFYKRVLGESTDVPMIGNCVTFEPHRRQGLYARLLLSICDALASQGHGRAIITCAPDNLASMGGIRSAGFARIKTCRSLVLFSRWIVFQTTRRP